ncbi:MAG: hypothetical protein AAF244_00695 [Pseudomonadota bacterium]
MMDEKPKGQDNTKKLSPLEEFESMVGVLQSKEFRDLQSRMQILAVPIAATVHYRRVDYKFE